VIVGVDARHLTGGRGVARYTRELVTALATGFPADEWRLFVPGRAPLPLAALERPNVVVVRSRAGGRAVFGAAALTDRPRLDLLLGGGLDVVWAPAPAPLALSRGVPFVLTVHDRSFEIRPHDFTAYERLWHRLARPRLLARRATRLLTDTAAVRAELGAAWAVDPASVDVVAPGVRAATRPDASAVSAARARHGLPERYVLAVGALEPRKAPELLVRAHARAGTGAALVFAGTGRLAGRLRREGVHLLGRVDDADLDALYAGALALALPSLLEGYGLPPLEAAVHGTPAVVSDLPVLRETLGDAVLYAPAGDEAAWTAALRTVAADAALRERLASGAAERAARRTWVAAAGGARGSLARAAGVQAAEPTGAAGGSAPTAGEARSAAAGNAPAARPPLRGPPG